MQPNELAPVPVTAEDSWNQEVSSERLRGFISRRLASEALALEDIGVTV